MNVGKQIAIIFIGVNDYLSDIPVEQCKEFETGFLRFMEKDKKDLLKAIQKEEKIDEKTEQQLRDAIEEFKKQFTAKS
jgi:F-type H+-transporting ATPase subunit alpha